MSAGIDTSSVLASMPASPDEPTPGACVRLERPEPGLVVIRIDPPHRKLAVFDRPLLRDLDLALAELERERSIAGIVLTGRSPTQFVAGADIDAIAGLDDTAKAADLARFGQRLFQRLSKLPAVKVAAVGGPVPGGAYEISLACDGIVLADHPSTRIGLPETRLGILPGWGGCQRLPRRAGVPAALAAILGGKLYTPREALKLGLVDRLAAPPDVLRIAREIAMRRRANPRRGRGAWAWLVDRNPLALAVVGAKARRDLQAQTKGRYPAPERALELVLRAPSTRLERGFEREARALGELAVTPVCKSLISIFRASEDARKLKLLPDGTEAPRVARAGVIGAGVMGGAIAGLLAEKGIDVRLSDLSRPALDAALAEHRSRIEKQRKRRRLEPQQAFAAVDRLETSSEIAGFARCDLVIEAVAERIEVKRSVFEKLARELAPGAVLATNTSSLSVAAIAETVPRRERVAGMHFFNPVALMPLVEVVRAPETSPAAVATVARLALELGKTPVVVADVAGFLVNRVLGPYLDEAVRLFELGIDADRIERAATGFGLPMGPLELLDEVGLDIASHAARSLEAAYGPRMKSSGLVGRLVAGGLLGKKTKAGFFLYEVDPASGRPRKTGLDPRASAEQRGPTPPALSDEDLRERLVLALVAEAARCLDERVVGSEGELDLATVFGMGFPPFLGGAMRYARARGLADVAAAMRRLSEHPDVRSRDGARERYEPRGVLASG